jgi:hypothetical protein
LLNSPDDLPHDGGLAASQHIERNHVGHRSHLRRLAIETETKYQQRYVILWNYRPEYNGGNEKIVGAGKA